MGSRHVTPDISPEDVEFSDNASDELGPWPAHPFTDPPPGDDGEPVTAHFLRKHWYAMWGYPLASTEELHEAMGNDEVIVLGTSEIWVEYHTSLADAQEYVAGASGAGYPSLFRAQPPPMLRTALERRKPWADITPRTKEGYAGRLRRQAHISSPELQAQWHRWAPNLLWLRRHKDRSGHLSPPPPEYLWATLWPQPPSS